MKDYANLTARLNAAVGLPLWQASDVATKNPLNGRRLLDELALIAGVDALDGAHEPLVIDSLSPAALAILRNELERRGVAVETIAASGVMRDNPLWKLGRFYKRALGFVVTWNRRRASLKRLGLLSGRAASSSLVLRSYAFNADADGGAYVDSYFKPLVAHLKEKKTPFAHLLYVYHDDPALFDKLGRASNRDDLDFLETYLRPLDFVKAVLAAQITIVKALITIFREKPRLSGVNIAALLAQDAFENFSLGGFLEPALHDYAARRLFASGRIERVVYPFENISWERLFLSGARRVGVTAKFAGFHHASPTLLSLMTVLGEGEAKQLPLPDEIIATGAEARALLVSRFHLPAEKIRVGCALRQGVVQYAKRREPGERIDALVTTSSMSDALGMLHFLKKTRFAPGSRVERVRLRFHPLLRDQLNVAIGEMSFPLGEIFVLDTAPTLAQSTERADVVVYSASTAAIECLMHNGTPLVHVDTGGPIESDPLIALKSLKAEVSDPARLEDAIIRQAGLASDEYEREAKAAYAYLENYFTRPSNDAFETFIRGPRG